MMKSKIKSQYAVLMSTYVLIGPFFGALPYLVVLFIFGIIKSETLYSLINLDFYIGFIKLISELIPVAYLLGLPAAMLQGLYSCWHLKNHTAPKKSLNFLFLVISSFIISMSIITYFTYKETSLAMLLLRSILMTFPYALSSLLAIYLCNKTIKRLMDKKPIKQYVI
ncbi:hypothetical protein N5853_08585 [Bartonella sp. HY329]|uniref:hypothetical protein n=1 Tax=unclassified Bartonella TaxID=2645622 RepID=UPI0021CAD171|nr:MULTISPECIES: hypothetical protein [unclassified Bartonella]UXM94171.1 hypothetical protein N5853_08585 [Bartonella sp. HY329]UXN08493.1 hypothetical protein N5852_08595 [Bartonella sp. HY328]